MKGGEIMKNKYLPMSFAIFGVVCGIFGFFTEISDSFYLLISSTFYLQMAIVSLLAAIYFKK